MHRRVKPAIRQGGVGKSGEGEKQGDEVEIHGEDGGDEQHNAEAAEDNQRFASGAERPAAADQIAGNAAAEKIAEVGGEKRNPDGDEAALEGNAFGNEVDGKPVGDEEPDGIGERFRNDGAPGLREPEEIPPARERFGDGGFGGRLVVEEHLEFGGADARVILRQVIEAAPGDEPEKAEHSGDDEGDAPPPAEIHGQDEKRRDGAADRGAAVIEGGGETAFALGEPFGDGFAGGGPVGGFAGTEKETESGEAEDAICEGGQERDDGVPRNADSEAAAGADAIDLAAANGLSDGIGDAESDSDGGVVGVGPVVLLLEEGREDGKSLAVDVVDDRGGEEEYADPPA